DVQVIERIPRLIAIGTHPDGGQRAARDLDVALDLLPRVQQLVADPVDVRSGTPRVRRGCTGQPVRGGAVAAIGGNPYHPADLVPEELQMYGQDPKRTRHIAWEEPHRLRFANVDVDQLPNAEVRRKLGFQRRIPAGHFVEV